MTDKFFLFYNSETIGYLSLDEEFHYKNIKPIKLKLKKRDINEETRDQGIQRIVTTNNSDIIVFIINKDMDYKTIVVWDLIKNHELANYTTNLNFILKFDANGFPFVV